MAEDRESRRIWWVAGGILALLAAWRLLPEVDNPLAPEPVAAHVAILAAGETTASDGPRTLPAGAPLRLFAVLEARDWRGRTVHFTSAPALRLGDRELPAESLRPWSGGSVARVRWFTLAGFAPYLAVGSAGDLERFRIVETFHPEWGDGWEAEVQVDPTLARIAASPAGEPLGFGTERFAVRIELFDEPGALTPSRCAASPGVDAALAGEPRLARVVAELPPPLARVSGAFGRVELEPAAELSEALAAGVRALEDRDLAFTRTRLLAEHLAAAGADAAGLVWREVDLARERIAWGTGVAPGDLLQSGPRVVVLHRDLGEPGLLDVEDQVFDPWRGLAVRRIGVAWSSGGSW